MLNDQLQALFNNYNRPVRRLIRDVGEIEQQFISMKTPRGIMNEIDEAITRIAKKEIARLGDERENNQ